MKSIFAISLGKAIFSLTRFSKIGGGSAAPGLYALKIDPNLVEKLCRKIPKNIIITGTNGKTTTTKMLAHFAQVNGLKVIRNHTGSNLERGIASTLINSYSHLTSGNLDLGIWELDEAAFNSVAPKINPDIVVFLNVFRDQLDRYGEVDTVVKKWGDTLKGLDKKTTILVNGDDANTANLKKYFKGNIQTFGVKDYKIAGESILHKKEKEKLLFEARNVKSKGLQGSSFQLEISNSKLEINLPLPGIYHIYDTIAALACFTTLFPNSKVNQLTSSLKSFNPAFGRVEKFTFKPHWAISPRSGLNSFKPQDNYIFLIKNPAGATQVFETIAPGLKKNDRLMLALNDKLADGTDVSWIWDAGFESLQPTAHSLQTVCSGTRAYDLANRLKYAEFNPKNILIEPNLEKAFKQAKKALKGRLFILPTYTAMLDLQKILAKSGIKKPYWEVN